MVHKGANRAARFGRSNSHDQDACARALALCLAGAPTLAFAEDACATQATDKKLAGAAKTSFMTKCEKTACQAQAADKKLARRGGDLFRQEVRQGRDDDVSLKRDSSDDCSRRRPPPRSANGGSERGLEP